MRIPTIVTSEVLDIDARTPAAGRAPTHRLRVCLVGPSLDILGGQSINLDRLRQRLLSVPDLDVTFLPVNPRLPGALRLLQRVKFVRTVVTSIAYVVSLLRQARRVDVLHVFSASFWSFLLAPVPAILVGRLYGKTVILNYRSGEAEVHLSTWRTAIPLMRLAHAIVVPSGYLVEVFARHGLRAQAVFNFVEVERMRYRERSGRPTRFLSNRNLQPLYNVSCTIRAFAHLQARVPDAELIVAGDGTEREALERLVASLALRNVCFLGQVPPSEMPGLYEAADVYLNSPNIDNMPNSVIEAFAAGIPVVTTDAGGIPFIVRHGENGLMVRAGDDAALAEQAMRLVHDRDLAMRIAKNAREECLSRYVWSSVVQEWRRVYRDAKAAGGVAASHSALGRG